MGSNSAMAMQARRRSDGRCIRCGASCESWHCPDCKLKIANKISDRVKSGMCASCNKVNVRRLEEEKRRAELEKKARKTTSGFKLILALEEIHQKRLPRYCEPCVQKQRLTKVKPRASSGNE